VPTAFVRHAVGVGFWNRTGLCGDVVQFKYRNSLVAIST
jgi:hypothetical protein